MNEARCRENDGVQFDDGLFCRQQRRSSSVNQALAVAYILEGDIATEPINRTETLFFVTEEKECSCRVE